MALGTVSQELSRLPNIPTVNAVNFANQLQAIQNTLNTLQANVTALQTDVTALRTGQATLVTQATLQQSITTLDARNYARTLNSRIFCETENIVMVPDLQNQRPPNFPNNVRQIRAANGQAMDALLNFYGLDVNGTLSDKRKRFSEYLGIRLL